MSGWKDFEKAAEAKALEGSQCNAPWHTIPAACSSLPRRQDGFASMVSMVVEAFTLLTHVAIS
jgi:hypothetical protein